MKITKNPLIFLMLLPLISSCGNSSPKENDPTANHFEETFTIYWKNYDGTDLYTSESVKEGEIPEYKGEIPVKETDNPDMVSTFVGWEPEVTAAKNNTVYTAVFHDDFYYYIDLNFDGWCETKQIRLKTGDEYVLPTPMKAGCKFKGWEYNGEPFPQEGVFSYTDDIMLTPNWEYSPDINDGEFSYALNGDKSSYSIRGSLALKESTEIVVPSSFNGLPVTAINIFAFGYYSNLERVVLPDTINFIGVGAFYKCSALKEIHIPKNVQYVYGFMFSGCSSLEKIVVDPENKYFDSRNDCNAMIETATNKLCYGCNTTIIPGDIKSIEEYAFNDLKISNVEIPGTVETIGDYAFEYCSNLKGIELPNDLRAIGKECFSGTGIEKVSIPSKISKIEEQTFSNCPYLSSVTLSDNITEIGKNAFQHCVKLKDIIFPESLTDLGDYCFDHSGLEKVTIPGSVRIVAKHAFSNCFDLTTVVLNEGVGVVNDYAFAMCSKLTNVTLSTTLRAIYDYAFYSCESLEKLILEFYLQAIGSNIIENTKIKSLYIPMSVSTIFKNGLTNGSDCTYYCASASQPAGWNDTWCDKDSTIIWGASFSGIDF